MTSNSDPSGSCTGCDIGRRAFIWNAALATVAIANAGAPADALPVRFMDAIAERDRETTYAIPASDSVNFDRGHEVILARHANALYAFDRSCPHQNTTLRWLEAQKQFQCPKHKSLYSASGVYIEGRATRSMDRHAIRRDGANVIVNLKTIYEEDHDAAEWKAAFITL